MLICALSCGLALTTGLFPLFRVNLPIYPPVFTRYALLEVFVISLSVRFHEIYPYYLNDPTLRIIERLVILSNGSFMPI